MKTLFLIGGAMGVGKTSVSHELKKLLPASVFWTATGAGIRIRLLLQKKPKKW